MKKILLISHILGWIKMFLQCNIRISKQRKQIPAKKNKKFMARMDVPIFRIQPWTSGSSPMRINSVYQQKQELCRYAQVQSLKRTTCIWKLNLQQSRSSIKFHGSYTKVFPDRFSDGYHQTHQFLIDDPE